MKKRKDLFSSGTGVFKQSKISDTENLKIKGGKQRVGIIIKDELVILSYIRD